MGLAALRRASRLLRILGTGFAIACFGALCIALSLWLPLRRALARAARGPQPPEDLQMQHLLHRAARGYLACVRGLGLLAVATDGLERLRAPGPHLVVANHPTLIDTLTLISLLPEVDCIVKPEWLDHPLLGRFVRRAGYIRNDQGPEVVAEAVRRLKGGRTVLIFPEGSRSLRSGMRPFRRGAAHVAIESGVPATPAVLYCDPPTLHKGQRLRDVPDRMFAFSVRFGEPLAAPATDGVPRPLAARRFTAELREYFEKKLLEPGSGGVDVAATRV